MTELQHIMTNLLHIIWKEHTIMIWILNLPHIVFKRVNLVWEVVKKLILIRLGIGQPVLASYQSWNERTGVIHMSKRSLIIVNIYIFQTFSSCIAPILSSCFMLSLSSNCNWWNSSGTALITCRHIVKKWKGTECL